MCCSYCDPRVSLATLGTGSHWHTPRSVPLQASPSLTSPDSPVRASPARVVPSPDSEEPAECSFYFRPVSRSPSRSRPGWRPSPPPSTITPPQSPPPRPHQSPYRALPSLADSRSPSFDLPSADFHGILKNRDGNSSSGQAIETTASQNGSEQRTPKKSILKVDSVEERVEGGVTRGVLKTYDQQPASTCSSPGQSKSRLASSSSSSEDITARTFSDVIIDPVPGQGRRSAPEVSC